MVDAVPSVIIVAIGYMLAIFAAALIYKVVNMLPRCFLCEKRIWPWQKNSRAEYFNLDSKLNYVFMHDNCVKIFFNLAKMIKESERVQPKYSWFEGKMWVNPREKVIIIFDDYGLFMSGRHRVFYSHDYYVYKIMKKVLELLPNMDKETIDLYYKRFFDWVEV